jgi:hypothetical protein
MPQQPGDAALGDLVAIWEAAYEASLLPRTDAKAHLFTIRVEDRGGGRWSVTHLGAWLSRSGQWDELPSHDDDWIEQHSFSRDDALQAARRHAPSVGVNGITAAAVHRCRCSGQASGTTAR